MKQKIKAILSVCLAVIFVFGAFPLVGIMPEKAKAADTYTLSYIAEDAVYNDQTGPYNRDVVSFRCYNISMPTSGDDDWDLSDLQLYAYYDFRSGASNPKPYCYMQDYRYYYDNNTTDTFANNGKEAEYILPDTVAENATESTFSSVTTNFSAKGLISIRPYYEDTAFGTKYDFNVTINYIGINTTKLYNYYNTCKSQYGIAPNSDIYTEETWQTYIAAMNTVNSILNRDFFVGGHVPAQQEVLSYLNILEEAVRNLEYLRINISTLYSSGAGYTYSNRPDSVQYNSNLEFDVNLLTGYTQSVPTVTVNNTAYSGTKNGNTYHFVIPIKTSVDNIQVNGVGLNTYTVTVPAGSEFYSDGEQTITATHGDTKTFTVNLTPAYSESAPSAYYEGLNLASEKNGNTVTYTIKAISSSGTVTFATPDKNTYDITIPVTDTGAWVVKNAENYSNTGIVHGNDYKFTVTVNEAYTQTTPEVSCFGNVLAFDSFYADGDSIVYNYTVNNVTADGGITVKAMNKNTYPVYLPSGEGYSVKAGNAGIDLSKVVHGTELNFSVELEEQYNRSSAQVYYLGEKLTAEAGIYSVVVTKEIKNGDIVVKNVKLNEYCIALALDTELGYTIEVGAGYNPKSVQSGSDFRFILFLDPAYSESVPTVQLSVNGGNTYTELKAGLDGYYVLDKVLSDCIVIVENVVINTYDVVFEGADGTALEIHENVEHGSAAVYGGETPVKASEKISEVTDTVENPDSTTTVTVTTVTKVYEFEGWSASTDNVTSDMVVTPVFRSYEVTTRTQTVNGEVTGESTDRQDAYFTVMFLNDDASLIYKENVDKGADFGGYDRIPVKESANPHGVYTFIGWDTDNDKVADILAGESTAIENIDKAQTFVAVFDYSLGSQLVNFYNYDGTQLLYAVKINQGEDAVYGGATVPNRMDDEYIYTFAGWSYEMNDDELGIMDKITVTDEDINLYAAYLREPIVYTYKYINGSEILQEGTFNFGDKYYYDGETPVKESTVSTVYTFSKWLNTLEGYEALHKAVFTDSVRIYATVLNADELLAIEGMREAPYGSVYTFTVTTDTDSSLNVPVVTNAAGDTLTAVSSQGSKEEGFVYTYEVTVEGKTVSEVEKLLTINAQTEKNEYKVTFVNEDGTLLKEYTVMHGDTPLYDGATPEKDATAEFTYTFVNWDKTIVPATDNIQYTAVYTSTVNEYTVTFVNEDGTVLQTQVLPYGETPVYSGETPEKAKTVQFTYHFDGWNKEIATVTGDAEYLAVYTSTVNEYTVTFVNEDGTVLQTQVLPYGETPVYSGETPEKTATAEFTYYFDSWDKEIAVVTGDAEYKAVFTSEINKYDVAFKNFDGTVLQSEKLNYGQMPEYKGAVPVKARTPEFTYTFKGWDKEITTVTDAAEYTAQFSAEKNYYTVTFKNYSGEVLEVQQIAYGESAVYTGATPAKAASDDYYYVFVGWDVDVESITEDTTATAVFNEEEFSFCEKFINFFKKIFALLQGLLNGDGSTL